VNGACVCDCIWYVCLFIDLMWLLFLYFSQTLNFPCILLGFASFLWADMLTDCEPPDILSSPQWKPFSALLNSWWTGFWCELEKHICSLWFYLSGWKQDPLLWLGIIFSDLWSLWFSSLVIPNPFISKLSVKINIQIFSHHASPSSLTSWNDSKGSCFLLT